MNPRKRLSPYGDFWCTPDFSQKEIAGDTLVISLDDYLSFPFEFAIRSFRKNNPSIKNVLLFYSQGHFTKLDKLKEELKGKGERPGMKVHTVYCEPTDLYPAMGPKSCVYFAPMFLVADSYFWLDLDTISIASVSTMRTSTPELVFYYTAENVASHKNDLFYHSFLEGGIYHGNIVDVQRYGFDRFQWPFTVEQPLVNTGFMYASYPAAINVSMALQRLVDFETPNLDEWTKEKHKEGIFIGHREQAGFDLALRRSGVPYSVLPKEYNFQTLTQTPYEWKKDEFLASANNGAKIRLFHFNGYRNADSPSRKLLENLIANSPLIRQFCDA